MVEGGDTVGVPVVLWSLGILAGLVQVLGLVILARIQKQSDDTNTKVTQQGETLARLTSISDSTASEVGRLRDRHDAQASKLMELSGARELAKELVREVADVFGDRVPIGRHRRAGDLDDRP